MKSYEGVVANGRSLRLTRCLSMVTAAVLTAALAGSPSTAFAQQSAPSRFKTLDHSQAITSQRKPLSLLANERVKVVVTMSVPSVAEVRAQAPGHVISKQAHDSIHEQVARQHAALEPTLVSRGGTVLAHYHDALNGIKVEIARSEVAGLASLPGVVQVVPVPTYSVSNVVSVPFIGAPQVWQGTPAFRGEHVKIAIIDTGIDYTHANFGGPGTVAAFAAAAASSTAPADPALFGPAAPKVKGGIDLVGDAYNASGTGSATVPVPDPNPLDCYGHGSHVSGTAAGFGVANDGTTYHGPYDEAAYTAGFSIGPGVAPLADLYAVRVFGCAGTTNVVTDAIDWAVHNDMDVISMSLGGVFGTSTNADSIASDNAAKAGIVVVAAAGNAGPAPYVTGDPASATDGISVAAMDARQFVVNGVQIALSTGSVADGVEANSLALPHGSVPAVILTNAGSLSLGCSAADYPAGGAPGALVIVSRGTCTFVAKATAAAAAGAVAIGVVNNAAVGLFNPAIPGITIPFIELAKSDTAKFTGATSPVSASITPANLPNSGFGLAASFTSGGPRTGDGALKPDVTAPGVNVFSTAIGTGNGGTYESGTSMATPHVAGVAALAVQAHKNWQEPSVRAAVVETASPAALGDYAPRIEGAGLVQAVGATTTDVTVDSGESEDGGLGMLSFGVAELTHDFHQDRQLIVRNHGGTPATFTATATQVGGVPHTVALSSSTVSVRGHDELSLRVSLTVPAATAGSTHDSLGNDVLQEVAGYIALQPTVASANHGVSLHIPYYLVPRARSNVSAHLHGGKNPSIRLENRNGVIAGNGDFYAWGLKNPKTGAIGSGFEPRAIGVQSNPISATDSLLVFAVNTYERFSNAAQGEFDIYIDMNGDGVPDYILFSADIGLVETGSNNGQIGSFLFNLSTGALLLEPFTDAPTDGSIVLMSVFASDLGITSTNPRLSYSVIGFDGSGSPGEVVPGAGYFNAFAPAVSNAMFVPVAPNTTLAVPVAIDRAEFQNTPAIGFMVVTEDNLSGGSEAALLPLED
jgi:minor extracellular serine protease Vpr